ncbi:MAG: hypothetical protein QME74_09885 [Candidatus Edwardsbacteria bacterium]|nr:hypothetical protein [Candidatus Edwardsbacteria bacterium]
MLNNNRDFFKSQGTKAAAGERAGRPGVTCPQCGAGIALVPGRSLNTCPFCGAKLSVHTDQPAREWLIRPALSRTECFRLLSAWLWENFRGAAASPMIVGQQWIPWRYAPEESKKGTGAYESGLCDPGKYPELHGLRMPCGEHLPFSEDAARGFDLGPRPEQERDDARIIHLPAYIASFRIGQTAERAVIEAATGTVRGGLPKAGDTSLRRWISFGIAALLLFLEAFLIGNLAARLIVLGVTYASAEIALGLIWEGLLWRR